jgi:hypothetical protein
LDHKDPSIRRRALDFISAFIDESNVENLVPDLLLFVKLADSAFGSDLITRIYNSSEKYAPNPISLFSTVLQIFLESGNYVSSEIFTSFCELITETSDLQSHVLDSLSKSILNFLDNQILVQLGPS